MLDEVTITLVYSLVTISSSSFIGTGGDGKVATGPSGSSAPGGNCGAVFGGEGATGTTGLEKAAGGESTTDDAGAAGVVASLQMGPHVAKIKHEIFVDLHRAGHDKSVKKNCVLAQIYTKLWSIYELHNYIILIIILNIIT